LTQLLSLKEDHKVDIPILSTVIKFVLQDIEKGDSNFDSPMYKQLSEFMLNISMKISDDPDIWELYAKYWLAIGSIENSVCFFNITSYFNITSLLLILLHFWFRTY
jgi:hypothetical protein